MRAPRIAIEHVSPQVDGARYMVKGIVGQALSIEADVFMDGHAQLGVQVLWQEANGKPVPHAMQALGSDRWRTSVTPVRPVRHSYTIEASTNLVNWTAVTNFVSATGTNQFTDTTAPNFNRRFYRAVTP